MSKGKISSIIAALVIAIVGFWSAGNYVKYNNEAVELISQKDAKTESNAIIYDRVWKTIQQKAGIADKYSKDFQSIYTAIMDKRYSENNHLLFSFVKESNPNFNSALLEDLSRTVESQRADFAANQIALIDIKREHDNLRKKFPSSIFLTAENAKEFEIKTVTSGRTKDAFKTGEENNVDLFK